MNPKQNVILYWLGVYLLSIEDNDTNYDARYNLVMRAMGLAADAGLKCGFRIDPNEPDWPVAFIELPAGQVSWHMPKHTVEYDGHTTEEKYARCREFAKSVEMIDL